jgi:hypothetical protein
MALSSLYGPAPNSRLLHSYNINTYFCIMCTYKYPNYYNNVIVVIEFSGMFVWLCMYKIKGSIEIALWFYFMPASYWSYRFCEYSDFNKKAWFTTFTKQEKVATKNWKFIVVFVITNTNRNLLNNLDTTSC